MQTAKKTFDLSSLGLHLIAMGLMLLDHLWATVVPGNLWLTVVGRAAFPIFAFLISEGYRHTRSVKKYKRRMLMFALAAEIPFNLMLGGSWIYPFQQNVMWTFLIALSCMESLDSIRSRRPGWVGGVLAALAAGLWVLLGQITMVDYGGYGVLMVLVFYLFPGCSWWERAAQAALLVYINWFMIRGQVVPVEVLGLGLELPVQGAAVLALLPVWCYRGRQGPHNKIIQIACYAFYPVHILILALLS